MQTFFACLLSWTIENRKELYMAAGPIKQDRLEECHRNGYMVEKALFDREEIELLRRAGEEDRQLDQHSSGKGDGEGGTVRLSALEPPRRHAVRHVRPL